MRTIDDQFGEDNGIDDGEYEHDGDNDERRCRRQAYNLTVRATQNVGKGFGFGEASERELLALFTVAMLLSRKCPPARSASTPILVRMG